MNGGNPLLTLGEKEAIVEAVAERAQTAQSALAAEYSGLTVGDMTALRESAREAGVFLRVVKNTLARRALSETEFSMMADFLKGPLILAFSVDGPSSAARVLTEFAKKNDKLVIRVVALPGQLLTAADAPALAKMPTKDEAISTLMAVMKAPVEKLARTINEVPGKLVRTVAAVRDSKAA